MKNSSAMRAFLGMSLMLGGMENYGGNPSPKERRYISKIEPPIPKGCKMYCFDGYGEIMIPPCKIIDIAFSCIALNEKSAVKKYNKWKVRFDNLKS